MKRFTLLISVLLCMLVVVACQQTTPPEPPEPQPIINNYDYSITYNDNSSTYYNNYVVNHITNGAEALPPEAVKKIKLCISSDWGGDLDDYQNLYELVLFLDLPIQIECLVQTVDVAGNADEVRAFIDTIPLEQLRADGYAYPTKASLKAKVTNGSRRRVCDLDAHNQGIQSIKLAILKAIANDELLHIGLWGPLTDGAAAIKQLVEEGHDVIPHVIVVGHAQYNYSLCQAAYDYLFNLPKLAFVGDMNTYRGHYTNGNHPASYAPKAFYDRAIADHAPTYPKRGTVSLGRVAANGSLEPRIIHALLANDMSILSPLSDSWGGRFVETAPGSNKFVDVGNSGQSSATVTRWRVEQLDELERRFNRIKIP